MFRSNRTRFVITWLFMSSGLMISTAAAQPGAVMSQVKIVRDLMEFPNKPNASLFTFPHSLASLGDLDGPGGPGAVALAVASPRDNSDVLPDSETGNVFIVFLDTAGQIIPGATVKIENPIPNEAGRFGESVCAINDLDGDGVTDIAVGFGLSRDGPFDAGAILILFLNSDGTVSSDHKISAAIGSDMEGLLDVGDRFGSDLAYLGVLDTPYGSFPAIAASAISDDDGGTSRGAVWVLFLNSDGTVFMKQKISQTSGGFGGLLADEDRLGYGLAALGDLDGDGVPELAAGAPHDDNDTGDPNADRGAIWVLFMHSDGTVKNQKKLTLSCLETDNQFGIELTCLGDLDGPGPAVVTLAAGTPGRFGNRNDVWLLFLDASGDLIRHLRISGDEGGFVGGFIGFDLFGTGVTRLGDLDGNGFEDLVVGEPGDDEAGPNFGALHVLFLHDPMCPADLNFDGVVNVTDLLRLLADWGTDGCANNGEPIIFGATDGVVNVSDLLELLAAWGPCP